VVVRSLGKPGNGIAGAVVFKMVLRGRMGTQKKLQEGILVVRYYQREVPTTGHSEMGED